MILFCKLSPPPTFKQLAEANQHIQQVLSEYIKYEWMTAHPHDPSAKIPPQLDPAKMVIRPLIQRSLLGILGVVARGTILETQDDPADRDTRDLLIPARGTELGNRFHLMVTELLQQLPAPVVKQYRQELLRAAAPLGFTSWAMRRLMATAPGLWLVPIIHAYWRRYVVYPRQ